MITNRPRPPIELTSLIDTPLGVTDSEYAASLNVYTYFSAENHGLNVFDASVAGAFETVVDLKSISGEVEYVIVAVDNNSGSQIQYGARLTFDGNIAYSTRLLNCPATSEGGIAIAGVIMFNDTSNAPYNSGADSLLFEHNLKIQSYISTLTSADLLVAYRYRLTGLVGG